MTPPIDLPPPPPAIHAPVPHQVAQSTSAPITTQAQPITNIYRRLPHYTTLNRENKGRWWHVKHWKGAKHKSQRSRSNKRKAARRK